MMSYSHFTQEERICLAILLKLGTSQAEIARKLQRNRSTISREIKRNSNKDGSYNHHRAWALYRWRRKRCVRKFALLDPEKQHFVRECLDKFWSPEIISVRWKMLGNKGLAHATIYRAFKKKLLPGYSAKTHLRRRGRRKNLRGGALVTHNSIHNRPAEANLRLVPGHLEGDTVYGGIGKACLLTLVDRKTRILQAATIQSRHSEVVEAAFLQVLGGVRPKSITLDNGSEFANFRNIEKNHNTTIYFADPRSPWQRGTNESINGLVRFFFPKGTNFHKVTPEEVEYVVDLINNRPRKCLGWRSPKEFICCT